MAILPAPRHTRAVIAITGLRATLAFGIGVALLLVPDRGEAAVAAFMGVYFLVSGLFSLAWSRRGPVLQRLALVSGTIGVVTGILVLGFNLLGGRGPSNDQILIVLGLVLGLTGALHLVGGFMVGELIDRWPAGHMLLGLLEIVLGVMLVVMPAPPERLDVVATLWAFSAGSVLAFDAFRAYRRWSSGHPAGSSVELLSPPVRKSDQG